MSELLGRDRLGRMYDDDWFIYDPIIPNPEVKLSVSPARTNYERYFADIAPLTDVLDAAFRLSLDGDEAIADLMLALVGRCESFEDWLNQEVTI